MDKIAPSDKLEGRSEIKCISITISTRVLFFSFCHTVLLSNIRQHDLVIFRVWTSFFEFILIPGLQLILFLGFVNSNDVNFCFHLKKKSFLSLFLESSSISKWYWRDSKDCFLSSCLWFLLQAFYDEGNLLTISPTKKFLTIFNFYPFNISSDKQ